MAIVLTTTPTYALPGDAVPLTATITGGTGANFIRLWCVDAPIGSVYRNQLDKTAAARVQITPPNAPVAGGILPTAPFNAQLEKGGRYTFVGQEYTFGASTYGGGFSNSPASYQSETKIGAEQTLYVYVGERMTHRLGSTAYGSATLVVYVWNDTIRPTSIEVHGVESPAIINPSSPRAVAAKSATATSAALVALSNVAVNTLAPVATLATLVNEIKTDLNNHYNNNPGAYHAMADTDNDTEIVDLPDYYPTPGALVKAAGVLYARLRNHMSNGPFGADRYHRASADFSSALICDPTPNEADMAYTFAIIADVVRCYETHRVDAAAHLPVDNNNPITSPLGPLLTLHRAFFAAMASFTPSAAGGAQSAVVQLVPLGFKLEN